MNNNKVSPFFNPYNPAIDPAVIAFNKQARAQRVADRAAGNGATPTYFAPDMYEKVKAGMYGQYYHSNAPVTTTSGYIGPLYRS